MPIATTLRSWIRGSLPGQPVVDADSMLHITAEATIELQAAAADGKAKPAKVTISAYDGDVMRVAGFGPVVVDLAGLEMPANVTLLADHQSTVKGIVGSASPKVEAGRALTANGTLSTATEAGRTIIDLHRDGVRFEASMGAEPLERRYIREREAVTVNGRTITAEAGGFALIPRSRLREISLLPNGASTNTAVAIAASQQGNSVMTFDQWLKENGWDRNSLSAAQVQKLEAAFRAEQGGTATATIQDPIADERQRQADIMRITAAHPQIQAQALTQGWDKTRAELEVMRASRPAAPTLNGSGGAPNQAAVIEAALCLSAGLPEKFVGDQYGDQVMNAAVSRGNRGAGLQAVHRLVLAAAGQSVGLGGFDNSTIRAAFEADRMLRASAGGFSTISLPGILSNVANKIALGSYRSVATSWQKFCRVASATNFKPLKRYRMIGIGKFEEVGADGELKHLTLAEQEYGNQVGTHGAIIALTRQMIINDDLSAFAAMPQVLGRMSAIKVDKSVFVLLLSNPSNFFASGNGNYFDGAASALSITSLDTAEQKFLDAVDNNSDPVLVMPGVLLVPTTLKTTSRQILNSTDVARDQTDDQQPSGNPFSKQFDLAVSPWINNAAVTGNSGTQWYLTSKPGDVAVMEVAFLNGNQLPTIESGDTSFDTLGMQMRGFHDFGVAMGDPRAGVKSKGAA